MPVAKQTICVQFSKFLDNTSHLFHHFTSHLQVLDNDPQRRRNHRMVDKAALRKLLEKQLIGSFNEKITE